MKCRKCGYENKEDARFCTSCGASLIEQKKEEQDQAALIELAEAYTGSLAAAKKIAAENTDMHAVSQACIAWIRAKDTTLFQDEGTKEEGKPTLDSFKDMEKALRDLDYEERIVTLLHCVEKQKTDEIAAELSIPEDHVIYYLQQAYLKNNPPQIQISLNPPSDKKKTVKKKRQIKKKTKEKKESSSKLINHLSLSSKILIAVIAACIIGTFLGVKNYARQEYERGTALLEEQKYDEASEPLLNAKRYGGSKDAGLKLGDVYYGKADYTRALEEYEACDESIDGVKEARIRTYEKLADASIEKSNYGDAAEYLQKEYDLNSEESTLIRLQACQNDGTCTQDDGSTFNAWGDSTKLVVYNNNKKLYQLEIEYNDDRTVKVMKGSLSDTSIKVTYNQFNDSQKTEASWQMTSSSTIGYSVQAVSYDDHENPTQITVTTPLSVKKTSYTYIYDNDQIQSAVEKNTTGIIDAKYHYEDDVLKEISYSDNSVQTFTYDKAGQKIHETTAKENGDIISDVSYEYNEDGTIKEKIVKQSANTLLPSASDQDITYTYTDTGKPFRMTIQDQNETAQGYYVANMGWIILYNTVEK